MPEKIKSIVHIVDDDESVRRAITRLIHSAGIEARTFAQADEFLKSSPRKKNACLIKDVKMRGLTGLELHQQLIDSGSGLPVIYITAFGTEEIRAQDTKSSAGSYFRKTVDDQALLYAIEWAYSKS